MSKGFTHPDDALDRFLDDIWDRMRGMENNVRVTNTDAIGENTTKRHDRLHDMNDALDHSGVYNGVKIWYVFEGIESRDAFFVANPELLFENVLVAIEGPTLDFSKNSNSQYLTLLYP